jgi:hypothetical protein
MSGHVPPAPSCCDRRVPRAPSPAEGITPGREDLTGPLGGRYPSFVAHTSPCARPKPSPRLGFPLAREVLAGCRQPLLGDDPSDIISATPAQALGPIPRRAPRLRSSIASPRTPASPHGKRVRRADLPPQSSFGGEPCFEAAVIRSPSGSRARSTSRLPRPRRTAPGRQAFHTTHRPAGYPRRDVASLHVRHGQLTWPDFHRLGRGLVGCSFPHTAYR